MLTEEIKNYLESPELGYSNVKYIPGRGICAIGTHFLFTVAILYGIDPSGMGWKGRYCFPVHKAADLISAFAIWDGVDDPLGQWIKHKGPTEYTNPNYKDL